MIEILMGIEKIQFEGNVVFLRENGKTIEKQNENNENKTDEKTILGG